MSKAKYPFLDLRAINAPYAEAMAEAARRVIASGRYIGGEETSRFEQRMCDITGAAYCVGTGNGLDALTIILRALLAMGRITLQTKVYAPANTYIATFLAATNAGLHPRGIDVDSEMKLDWTLFEQTLEQEADAGSPVVLLNVHLYGDLCWSDEAQRICRKHNVIVVEDCAQSIGATMHTPSGRTYRAGALGIAAAFSFYPTKNIGAVGDAGCVTTSDADLAAAVRAMANYGSDRRYHNIYKGVNSRLDPLQAAMLNVKLEHIDAVNDARIANAKVYSSLICNKLLRYPRVESDDRRHVFHQYVVQVADGRRDEFRAYLEANGIETDVHYPLIPSLQPCYTDEDLGAEDTPRARALADLIVSLPISQATTPQQISEIAQIINRFE